MKRTHSRHPIYGNNTHISAGNTNHNTHSREIPEAGGVSPRTHCEIVLRFVCPFIPRFLFGFWSGMIPCFFDRRLFSPLFAVLSFPGKRGRRFLFFSKSNYKGKGNRFEMQNRRGFRGVIPVQSTVSGGVLNTCHSHRCSRAIAGLSKILANILSTQCRHP